MKYKEVKTNNKKEFLLKLERLKQKGYEVVDGPRRYVDGFIIIYEASLIKKINKE